MISQFCDRNLSAVPMSEIRRAYDKLVHENNNSASEKSSATAASNTVDKFIERRSDVELSLHSNKLTVVVPVDLFQLEHLVTLFLHRNQLATLPDELRRLRSAAAAVAQRQLL
jgi:hypothetical protein